MKLIYKDPKKKRLQKIEIALMVILLPPGLFFGFKSFQNWQNYNKADAVYQAASDAFHHGNVDECIVKLEEAVKIYPEHYSAWEELGVCHHMKGDIHKEVETYTRAIAALPNNGNLHRELATAHHKSGDHEKELAEATLAMSLPNSDPVFTMRVHQRALKESNGEISTEKLEKAHEHSGEKMPPKLDGMQPNDSVTIKPKKTK